MPDPYENKASTGSEQEEIERAFVEAHQAHKSTNCENSQETRAGKTHTTFDTKEEVKRTFTDLSYTFEKVPGSKKMFKKSGFKKSRHQSYVND